MSNAETTLLYVLSTLAQTCAALAAFVGAVGLYRLQLLTSSRNAVYEDLYSAMGRPTMTHDDVLRSASAYSAPVVRALLVEFDRLGSALQSGRSALIGFEAWNLLLIFVSLIGFNYIKLWASSPATFWGVWLAAIGTVAVTGYAVYAWTRG